MLATSNRTSPPFLSLNKRKLRHCNSLIWREWVVSRSHSRCCWIGAALPRDSNPRIKANTEVKTTLWSFVPRTVCSALSPKRYWWKPGELLLTRTTPDCKPCTGVLQWGLICVIETEKSCVWFVLLVRARNNTVRTKQVRHHFTKANSGQVGHGNANTE